MIPLARNLPSPAPQDVRLAIVGLGGAGSTALDRVLLDGLAGADFVALNTDTQALTGSIASEKIQLGRVATRGLGAGGDPDIGYAATEEAVADIRAALEGAHVVFLCVGLGGGTGSGGARLVASLAREMGAQVVAVATLPFAFEGHRRMLQAGEALAALQGEADVTICFENDRMGDAVSPLAGIQEAFAVADQTISQSVRALAALTRRRGLMHLGFDELATALRSPGAAAPRCLFGYGEADGDNRANDALTRALKNPLMDRGRLLDDVPNVLVNVAGGPDMTLNEVQILMEALNRHIGDESRILFGVAVDPQMGEKMSVTILGALPGDAAVAATVTVRHGARAVEPRPAPHRVEPRPAADEEPSYAFAAAPREAVASLEVEPVLLHVAAHSPLPAPALKRTEAKQEQMELDPVKRGRFEHSEPTIVDGQDLDIPTFLRRNVKVK